jgi:hypothetical protein
MSIPPLITSVGAPPEKHASRIVGEMLRFLARNHRGVEQRMFGLRGLGAGGQSLGPAATVSAGAP